MPKKTAPRKRLPRQTPLLGPLIADRLRLMIIDGTWAPGTSLPSRLALCRTLDCSTLTLQHAIDQLEAEGFVRGIERHGTFVHSRPPHLKDIAVVFPFIPPPRHNHFLDTLDQVVRAWRGMEYRLTPLYDLDLHEDNPTYLTLRERVRQRSLAGLIFAASPYAFSRTPLMLSGDTPRLVMSPKWPYPGRRPMLLRISPSTFSERAVERLAKEGCRNIAVLTHFADEIAHWSPLFEKHGLRLRPHWFLQLNQVSSESARGMARLLFTGLQKERPDGAIITDDNFVEAFTTGMTEEGIKPSDGIRIITHCNYPLPTRSLLPAIRLGLDVNGLLDKAVDMIDRARRSPPVPPVDIRMVFEEELQARRA